MFNIDDFLDPNKKIIISLSWRDIKSPKAGGAETHTHSLLRTIDNTKYNIIHISFMYEGLQTTEYIDDILYVRYGMYLEYILFCRKLYRRYRDKVISVLDQCNTWRAFTRFWVKPEHRVFYIHQLTREIWYIQSKGLFAWIGEHTETFMLRLNRHDRAITVSRSTMDDLVSVGFDPKRITIIPNTLSDEILKFEVSHPNDKGAKESDPTFIYVGRYARYKGIDDTIEAFGQLKSKHPDSKLWIVGKPDETYLDEVIFPICNKYGLYVHRADKTGISGNNIPSVRGQEALNESTDQRDASEVNPDIIIWGFVDEERKYELMQRAHALVCPSIREGWGIIISEAGYLGTPSIVYDSPGLRDAVDYGRAGFMCSVNTPVELRRLMDSVIEDTVEYNRIKRCAYEFADSLKPDPERISAFFDVVI